MNHEDAPRQRSSRLKVYLLWGTLVWTIILASSLIWNILYTKNQTLAKADVMSQLAFKKDAAFRMWVTFHGGVYVPVTGETPSNPYLNIPEKDETLASGKPITLMNPAYVMRQYYEKIDNNKGGVKGHITSLKPLRPENKPDPWEEQSLQSFETGKKEATAIQILGKTEYVRLMKPFVTIKGCLKCHASQGYKEGDIRGGISVSVPMAPLRILEKNQLVLISGFHALSWVLGFAGIFLLGKSILKSEKLRAQAEESLRQSEESKRLLLQAVGEGIFGVDTKGQTTFVNPAALRLLGFAEEEMLGQRVHALIHHSHEDGSDYPEEECPMYGSYARAEKSIVTDEVLWCKDGSCFPVEYASTPITKDGKAVGAVVTFRDITERKRTEEALQRLETKFRTLYDSNSDAVMLLDEKGFFDCNQAALVIFGCATREEFCSKHPADLSPTEQTGGRDSMTLANQMIATAMKNGSIQFEWMHKRNDTGETFPADVLLTAMELDGQAVVQAVVRDITERRQNEEVLRESEEKYRVLFDGSIPGILITDSGTGRFEDANLSICRMLGYPKAELLQLGIADIHPKDQLDLVRSELESQIRGGQSVSGPIPCLRKDGTVFYAEIAGTSTMLRGKRFAVGFFMDITERRQSEEKIQHMAFHDSLTGLPNRKLFSDRFGIALVQAQRNQKKIGIAMVDLDNFKGVNDTLGHEIGDLFLKATAERLSAALRKGDTVARVGGDEFVLILPDLKLMEDAVQVAQKIVEGFRKPFFIDTHQLNITTSIGIAVCPDDGTDEVMLLKKADSAMYQAKEAGRDRFKIYNEA